MSFKELNLNKSLLNVCKNINYIQPTKIQQMAIPSLLNGSSAIINSQTGSGKTATFGFPIIQKLSQDPYGIFALIITPSRELGLQIQEQLQNFGQSIGNGLKVILLVGGVSLQQQYCEINKIPHIIICTPGRMASLLEKQNEILQEYIQNLEVLVLDECDRLFEESIRPDIRTIMQNIPKKVQIILTSATIYKQLDSIDVNKYLECENEFIVINAEDKLTVENLTQSYLLTSTVLKDYALVHLIDQYIEKTQIIIFTNKRSQCHQIYTFLSNLNYACTSLHSLLDQKQRFFNITLFKSLKSKILIATNIAARGLDIQSVDLIINYDIPKSTEDYIHRVGRTARAKRPGQAISFITNKNGDKEKILRIEEDIGKQLTEYKVDFQECLQNMTKIQKIQIKIKQNMSKSGETQVIQQEEKKNKIYRQQNIQKN